MMKRLKEISFNSIKYDLNTVTNGSRRLVGICFNSIKYDLNSCRGRRL